jgi:hypothetical protein
MRPTELYIIGRSKRLYLREVQPALTGELRLAPLVQRLATDATTETQFRTRARYPHPASTRR